MAIVWFYVYGDVYVVATSAFKGSVEMKYGATAVEKMLLMEVTSSKSPRSLAMSTPRDTISRCRAILIG